MDNEVQSNASMGEQPKNVTSQPPGVQLQATQRQGQGCLLSRVILLLSADIFLGHMCKGLRRLSVLLS